MDDSPIRKDKNGKKYVVCMCEPPNKFINPFKCLECGMICNTAYFVKYVW